MMMDDGNEKSRQHGTKSVPQVQYNRISGRYRILQLSQTPTERQLAQHRLGYILCAVFYFLLEVWTNKCSMNRVAARYSFSMS